MSKRQRSKESAREEILEAAAAAIAAHGFHGMSMRKLAAETGRSLANFYNHFGSKEDVLVALHRRAFETLIQHAEDMVSRVEDPSGQLYLFILSHVRYFTDHPDVMRVLVHEASGLSPTQRPAVRELKARYFGIARGIVSRLICEGCGHPGMEGRNRVADAELERAAYCVFGMLNWVFAWYDAGAHGTPDDVAATIHRTALCGVTGRCPRSILTPEVTTVVADIELPNPLRAPNGEAPS